ncbi:MAG: outer membrane lipoprotein carrier protein LolA [Polyangiales bacterium]
MTSSRLVLALLLASAPAVAQPRAAPASPAPAITLDEVLRRFRAVPGISARFRESRQLQLLAAPLVSEGTLHYAPPGRLARRTEQPEPAVALLEGNRLRFRDASGEQSLDLDAMPAARQFLESFTALVAGTARRSRAATTWSSCRRARRRGGSRCDRGWPR